MEAISRYSTPSIARYCTLLIFSLEEEKRDAKAKKDEEKAKKAEEKRLKEEEKRRAKEAPSTSKAVVEPEEDRPTTASEPPVLDPIPKVEPISAEAPAVASLSEEINPVETIVISSEEPRGTVTPPVTDPDRAELVATRVLSAPVVDDELPPVPDITPTGTLEQAAATPLPPAESTSTTAASKDGLEPSTAMESTTLTKPTKHTEPLTSRILPTSTTQTTITAGPSSAAKEPKSESKVSSWLKSKFSASRNSKLSKPADSKGAASPESSTTQNKAFVGGAALTAPAVAAATASNTSLDPATSSVHEVAFAGRTQPADAAMFDGAKERNDDDDLYAASVPTSRSRQAARDRSSSSSPFISSVSSDEDTRGRSTMRREETESGDEFEEALDHFDEEALAPPAPLGESRIGGSPVRDSKFQEIL